MSTCTAFESLPLISVVVIGRNEGARLVRCLESIFQMNYPLELLEVVYVDSCSTDNSVKHAREMGVNVIELQGTTTAARGRNIGWRSATAPYVLFLDGDTLVDPDFVSAALPNFADTSIAGVFGNRREADCAGSLYNAIFDLDWPSTPGFARYFGGDALVSMAALREVGGYNSDLIAGEEPDMCRRMRALDYRILHIDAPMTFHDLRMTRFNQYWRRSLRTGHAYAEISALYARTSDPLWLSESRRNLVRGAFWTCLPLLALVLSLSFRSVIPLAVACALSFALFLRTSISVRRRKVSWKVALAYGIHAHLQHIPIFFGQLRYHRHKRDQVVSNLIEYKDLS